MGTVRDRQKVKHSVFPAKTQLQPRVIRVHERIGRLDVLRTQ
jgi:hypothetical protein